MRFLRVLPLLLAVAVIWLLNHPIGALPALGKVIDPVNGAMAAAEPVDEDFNKSLHLNGLQAPVTVWLEDRLVPHIRAGNDHDLYYTQGYVHAYFRLWQMDIQTRAAGGRVSEVAGAKAIEFDRGQRRKGMVFGAQHSLAAMEAEPRTKAMLDAYRDGINAYIHNLNYRGLPIEYKLMGFAPEDWTNIRTALLMKYMADDLTGKTDDIAYTILRDQLGQQEFDFLFPEKIKGSKPVIPEGTKFDAPSLKTPPVPVGDIWAHFYSTSKGKISFAENTSQRLCHSRRESHMLSKTANAEDPFGNDKDWAGSFPPQNLEEQSEIVEGSNNWAISGSHTASGKPILCNDPHLGLNLPSLWFEMQLTAPGINAYGASLPGAPGIVIGFNEKISWGFTNNYRDVKDFYEISETHNLDQPPPPPELATSNWKGRLEKGLSFLPYRSYHFGREWIPFQCSIEVIKVKNEREVKDTVLYTIHGPVMYDPSFPPPDVGTRRGAFLLACSWMAHRGTNELLSLYLLNRARDYTAFTQAIQHFECPAQNFAYADRAGNIAMWGQGRFINKWKGQGKYVMEGRDSATLWGQDIPMAENPHVLNPPQGYVASANQTVTDSTYPYWYNQSATEWRSWEINFTLRERIFDDALKSSSAYLQASSVLLPTTACKGMGPTSKELIGLEEMIGLQNSEFSLLNFNLVDPYKVNEKSPNAGKLLSPIPTNDWRAEEILWAETIVGTRAQIFWSQLYKDIWQDEFPTGTKYPSSEITVQLLLSDSTSKYYDDKKTPQKETLRDIVRRAFHETTDSLNRLTKNESTSQRVNESTNLQWYRVKNTTLTHLAKIPAFSYDHLKIGGWSNTINACTGNHGPSWRMIVEMDSIPKAYAVYPGGQSGNPGSVHYSDYIQNWVEGKYFTIQFLTAATTKNPFKYTWTLKP